MVKLFRWLLGYVSFSFSGGFNDGFINDCYNAKINVQRLKTEGNSLCGECLANQYIKLHRLALKNGGRVYITKKHGIIFTLLKLKNRWGLLLGAVLFVCIISFLSGFIWEVEITGNERINRAEIVSFFEENGIKSGAPWRNIDKNRVENLMLASFEDIAWVHINELGTKARVEINEAEKKPDITPKTVANIIAKKDGLIVRTSVTSGWAEAKVGDSVTKGDLLISGIYESEKKKGNQFAHASGEYIAEVKEPFSLTVSRKQSYKEYRQVRTFKKLCFFGLKMPLYFAPYEKKNSSLSVKGDYVRLNNNELPIGIITVKEKRYDIKYRILSDSELEKLTEQEINKKLGDEFSEYEIIKKSLNVSLNADEASVSGSVICLEDIGEEAIIKINNK